MNKKQRQRQQHQQQQQNLEIESICSMYLKSPILPGIDDMFVIMQCFDNLKPSEKKVGDNAFNIGMAMRHAGVAITVTSITDVVVFGVGASTVRQIIAFIK